MTVCENIKQQLAAQFPGIEERVKIPRPRRIFVDSSIEEFKKVFEYAINELGFKHLCTITGLDELDKFSLIYHLAQENGVLLNIKISLSHEDPVVDSIIGYFPAAEIYERELVDLFGIRVNGLPEGLRYPLTDDWPLDEHPLRKDWKPKTAS
ncbi:MAG: NADH-quinone oxidoreductase subunit C [Candidatus Omnitrophota bacterium]|jgi:NADH:ubiquinone oxidoreductase subunit C